MNRKTISSVSKDTILKLKVLAKRKENVRSRLVVTAKRKESIRGKLAVIAKQLVVTAKDKEIIRSKLEAVAKEKEDVRKKLVVTAEQLAQTAKEKESIRLDLAVTAKKLSVIAKEKEDVRKKLVVTAEQLAQTARDKESIRRKLAVTAENLRLKAAQLSIIAKEKESIAEKLNESYETVQQTKAKDEAMLASIGDGVIAINNKFVITLFNPAAERLTGFSMIEAIGKPMGDIVKFVNEKDRTQRITFIEDVLHSGNTKKMPDHLMLITKTGTETPVGDSAASIIDAKGIISGVILVLRDVSQEREIVKMKDEFVSLASHELRTPMTAISGFVSMILSGVYGPVNESLKEPLGYIAEGTDRLIRLVADMLNVSRIEAGRLKFELTSLDLSKLVNDVVTSLEPVAQEKGISLSFKETEIPMVQADADKVKQILNNLIGNSLKFTNKGGSVTVLLIQQDEVFVKTDITDTGIGIAQESQGKLFQKFAQIASQESGKPKGTGLGLYISSELARKMGGNMWIENSEVGKGSTFAFSLPLADSEVAKKIFEEKQKESGLHPDQKSLEEGIAKKEK